MLNAFSSSSAKPEIKAISAFFTADEVAAGDRLPPFATDEIAVFRLVRVFDDLLVQHVIPPIKSPGRAVDRMVRRFAGLR